MVSSPWVGANLVKTASFDPSFKKEGITGFWSGLTAYYFRLAPHVIITLLASEQWRKIFKIGAYKPKKEGKD